VTGSGTTIPATVPRPLPRNIHTPKWLSPTAPLYVSAYHLGPVLHAGRNVLAVRVSDAQQATLYLDGHIADGTNDIKLATSSLWGASGTAINPATAPTAPAAVMGPPSSAWGMRPTVLVAPPSAMDRPSWMLWGPRLAVALAVLGAWLVIAMATRRPGTTYVQRLCVGAFGALPGALLTAVAADIGGIPNLQPPNDHTWPVLAGLLALTTGGGALLSLILALGRATPVAPHQREVAWRLPAKRSGSGGLAGSGITLAWRTSLRAYRPWRPAMAGAGDSAMLAVAEGARRRAGLALPGSLLRAPVLSLIGHGRAVAHAMVRRWDATAVGVIALGMGVVESYRIAFEPFWQDELYTLLAGQGIRQHIVPKWPSGFLYWKAELYDLLVAGVGRVFGDTTSVLRGMSVTFYVLTILAFGLLLVPAVIGRARPWLTVGITALFATAPVELIWAREARMYQLAQLFLVVFMALFLRALREPTTRRIALACAALLLMYLSHEESFIVLPGAILVGVLTLRRSIVARRNRPWLYFGAITCAVIAVQFALAFTMKPNYFGYDLSNRPFIVYDSTDAWYYLSNVFFTAPGLSLVSTLAIVAMVVGLKRRDLPRNLVSAFLVSQVVMLSAVFTMRNARYAIIAMPALFLLGGLGAIDVVGFVRRLLSPHGPITLAMRQALRLGTGLAAVMAMILLAASMTANVESYGILASQVFHAPYTHKYRDYPYVVNYVLAHEQPGDLYMTIAPPIIPSWYMGRAPDMVIPGISDQRLLKIFERDGHGVDSLYGVPVILSPTDLVRVLEKHHRVWLVTDDRYVRSLPPGFTDIINAQFRKVDEGYAAAVYLGSAAPPSDPLVAPPPLQPATPQRATSQPATPPPGGE
jgi:hypothetical protein